LYAIISTGGKQYRVSEGDRIRVERLDGEVGEEVVFDEVLFVGSDAEDEPGLPKETIVSGTIVGHGKSDKVVVFKFKRRKMYRRKRGHRQPFTEVQIARVGSPAKKASKAATTAEPEKASPKKDKADTQKAARTEEAEKQVAAPPGEEKSTSSARSKEKPEAEASGKKKTEKEKEVEE